MSAVTSIILALNKLFPKVVHPFNLENDGVKTYGEWQYEKGAKTLEVYAEKYKPYMMFENKRVLDIGCGAAGKSLYFLSQGAESVTGVDIMPEYERESMDLAKKLGYESRFHFICASADCLPWPDKSFDTIIMNDAMEHVDKPEAVLAECARILKPGGRLFVNFPPYNHPYGAHLSDLIGMPWVHLFFSDKTLIAGYKELCRTVPDGDQRIAFRISRRENGEEYFSYINKMTLKRFKGIKARCSMEAEYYREVPLRRILSIPARLPFFREFFVKMAVCVFRKQA